MSASSAVRRWVPPIAGIVLGAVFLVAAFLKGADPKGFADQITTYKIISGRLATLAAYTIVPIEFVLAAALVMGFRRRLAAVATGLLLIFFIGVTAWGWAIGKTEGCGCFGSLSSRGPGEVIVEDVLLLALALLAALPRVRRASLSPGPALMPDLTPGPSAGSAAGSSSRFGLLRGAVVVLVAAGAVAFEFAAPRLPLDDLVTVLRPGQAVTALDLGLDEKAAEFVALLDLKGPDIEATVAALNAIAAQPRAPRVVAYAAATEQERGEFFFTRAPAFELHEAPVSTLQKLARRLPRFFITREGRVARTWNDGPPAPAAVAGAP